MYTLGIHGGLNTINNFNGATPTSWLHDASAVLCRNGIVVAGSEEERFVRIKHVNYFPIEAIRYCLDHEKIQIKDVAKIVLSSSHMEIFQLMANNWRFGTDAMREHRSFLDFAEGILREEFGSEVREKLVYAGHHHSHTLSAVRMSGFDDTLCLVMDGWGDNLTGMISIIRDGKIEVISELKNLGPAGFYLEGTQLIGFSQFDEYKVMGLAPYGDLNKYITKLQEFVTFEPEGHFTIKKNLDKSFKSAFRSKDAAIEQRHKDFAAALQLLVENIILHVLSYLKKETGINRLCLSGGFAQNCSANGKVLMSGLFNDVFVQPAAYDAGCAIGAAIHGFELMSGKVHNQRLEHVYWGANPVKNSENLDSIWSAWQNVLDVERHSDISMHAADLIADGHVIGWVQGRAEFGARALGNRSILADPRPAENKNRINSMVKKREAFRPFAPSVLEERMHEFFEVPEEIPSLPFMVFVVKVRQQFRELFGAITHVDGTARIQSVSKQTNPRYWRLLKRFNDLTSIPIVLNTSFNNNHEPIVNTVEDAINCFLSTNIDYLIIDEYLVQRKRNVKKSDILRYLIPIMSHRFYAVRHSVRGENLGYFIHDGYLNLKIPISSDAYNCLVMAAERKIPFEQVLSSQVCERSATMDELFDLWCRRVFYCEGSAK
jgi:carbamoyltransferase